MGEIGGQLFQFRAQVAAFHVGAEALQRAFQWNAVPEHGGELLVEEGKLNWKDKVIDYIPEFKLSDPYITRELNLERHLTLEQSRHLIL